MTLQIEPVPLLKDNYAYLVREPNAGLTAIVDPSEAGPVLRLLAENKLNLTHVINTHHHWDHTGGNLELKQATGAVIVGPSYDRERIPGIEVEVSEEAPFRFGGTAAKILHVPGHTKGQVSFWFREDGAVFTGDTLFAMGCGRLFEGTPAEMWASMQKLMGLPDDTRVYCGHEYTEANGEFALTLEPENKDLQARMKEVRSLRAKDLPTVPSTIGLEKKTNPFLRPDSPEIRKTLNLPDADNVAVFGKIRALKDRF
jgi:hydroxyacylglutathione hydrolase